ncbi:dihydropteroate synthase [Elizabethkingia sp. JS20170427COW]|nr:dihydropteroate synthase [Elizabethkingia sp. JS20170427COW]
MGILNITPDSFSDGGNFNHVDTALAHAEKMIEEGADILDLGAQSSNPNSSQISAKEEISRFKNIISTLKRNFPDTLLSVDTFYSETTKFAHQEGIDIINDISTGQFDSEMLNSVAETGLPYILMHINPSYQQMHEKIHYYNIVSSINLFFAEKTQQLNQLGIHDVILDPGFGFGKTIEDQYTMIEQCEFFNLHQLPLLIGISRKSFIYKPLGKSPLDIVEETQKLHLEVLKKGAKILRVHDVAATKATLSLLPS